MKIFISSDMEGTAGVVDWEQCRSGGPQYEYYAGLLGQEINAAIEGGISAGATEFLVNDSHGRMANLKPDALAGHASYLSGRFKPMYMMEGLDRSFDAVFFVSYHGSMSSEASTLSHTYYPGGVAEVSLNGEVVGEAGVNALVSHALQVPIVLVTGDETTADETRRICPGVRAAVVKRSVSRFAAESLHPAVARQVIYSEAAEATLGVPAASLPEIDLPASLSVSFRTSDYADLASRLSTVKRDGRLGAVVEGRDTLELFRTFITIVMLCRGLTE